MTNDWNLTKTQFEIVLEYFVELKLEFFLSKEEREEKFGLRIILSK